MLPPLSVYCTTIMRRNHYRPMPSLLLAAMMMIFIAATNRTSAQQSPNCCSYTVIVHGLSGTCSQTPISVSMIWNCSPLVITSASYTGNGTYNTPLSSLPLPPCPSACTVLGISLDGINYIPPGHNSSFNVNGCCLHASTGFDAAGCIVVKISRC